MMIKTETTYHLATQRINCPSIVVLVVQPFLPVPFSKWLKVLGKGAWLKLFFLNAWQLSESHLIGI